MNKRANSGFFDIPGPLGARRTKRLEIVSYIGLATVAILAISVFAVNGGLDAEKWVLFADVNVVVRLLSGAGATIQAAVVAGLISLLLACALAIGRLSSILPIAWLCVGIIELSRSLPTLLILYFTILALPSLGVTLPVYWQLVVALIASNVGMLAEIFRSSMLAVPEGQTEASSALGLGWLEAQALVVLPQAFKAAIPSLLAQSIFLLKSSTLGYVVSYQELLLTGRVIGEFSGNILQSIIVVLVVFIVMNMLIAQLSNYLASRPIMRGYPGSGDRMQSKARRAEVGSKG